MRIWKSLLPLLAAAASCTPAPAQTIELFAENAIFQAPAPKPAT